MSTISYLLLFDLLVLFFTKFLKDEVFVDLLFDDN